MDVRSLCRRRSPHFRVKNTALLNSSVQIERDKEKEEGSELRAGAPFSEALRVDPILRVRAMSSRFFATLPIVASAASKKEKCVSLLANIQIPLIGAAAAAVCLCEIVVASNFFCECVFHFFCMLFSMPKMNRREGKYQWRMSLN